LLSASFCRDACRVEKDAATRKTSQNRIIRRQHAFVNLPQDGATSAPRDGRAGCNRISPSRRRRARASAFCRTAHTSAAVLYFNWFVAGRGTCAPRRLINSRIDGWIDVGMSGHGERHVGDAAVGFEDEMNVSVCVCSEFRRHTTSGGQSASHEQIWSSPSVWNVGRVERQLIIAAVRREAGSQFGRRDFAVVPADFPCPPSPMARASRLMHERTREVGAPSDR
jgi:hypothetical protein